MSCEFCEKVERLKDRKTFLNSSYLGDDLSVVVCRDKEIYLKAECGDHSFYRIKYCPLCSKKLSELLEEK